MHRPTCFSPLCLSAEVASLSSDGGLEGQLVLKCGHGFFPDALALPLHSRRSRESAVASRREGHDVFPGPATPLPSSLSSRTGDTPRRRSSCSPRHPPRPEHNAGDDFPPHQVPVSAVPVADFTGIPLGGGPSINHHISAPESSKKSSPHRDSVPFHNRRPLEFHARLL